MADRTEEQENFAIEAAEELARRLGISRADQDAMALRSHLQAALARDGRHLLREVVPLKNTAEEFRDQSADAPEPEDLQEMPTLVAGGTLTRGNTSALHDGAAILVAVSGGMWERLGRPPALRVAAGAATGVPPAQEIEAPILALRRLLDRIPGRAIASLGVVEMSEQSAVQAIALRRELGIADDALNPDGGAIVRGHPLAAAGAVLVVRLFSRMVRARSDASARLGAAVLGASGGQGVAALFEAA